MSRLPYLTKRINLLGDEAGKMGNRKSKNILLELPKRRIVKRKTQLDQRKKKSANGIIDRYIYAMCVFEYLSSQRVTSELCVEGGRTRGKEREEGEWRWGDY